MRKEASMRSLVCGTLALVLAYPSLTTAQDAVGTKESTPKIAEVRFADGSVVRMNLLQEQLEVMTKYGKLSIPIGEIRRIEFGLHMPSGLHDQIGASIKLLGSDV